MAHETLTCAEDITLDRLSALRDEALPARETDRLRAHIAECAACRARLEDFDTLAGALHAQRELDPGDRVLDGVHVRLAGQSRPARSWRGGRGVWAGLAALAPVAALILLFVYVFSSIAPHPASGPAPTASLATPTSLKPIYPTATPATIEVPQYTQAVPASVAWGQLTPIMSHAFTPNGSEEFIPQAYSSNLSTIGGVLFNFSDSGAGAQMAQLAYYTMATGTITKIGPTWRGSSVPWGGMSSIDSRYIVYGFNSQPSSWCGACNSTIWSLDRASGQAWEIRRGLADVISWPYPGYMEHLESADHVAFLGADNQNRVADLVAHSVTQPIGAQPATTSSPGPSEWLLGFQWPYLMYAETPAATPPAQRVTSLNILDLATGVNTPIAAPILNQSGNPVSNLVVNMALVGNALYAITYTQLNGVDMRGKPVNGAYGELYRLDNAFAPGGKFIALAIWPSNGLGSNGIEGYGVTSSLFAASNRLIWLGSGYFWDETELRLVTTSLTDVQLVGPYIVATDAQLQGFPAQTFHVTAYDMSTFPAPPGG